MRKQLVVKPWALPVNKISFGLIPNDISFRFGPRAVYDEDNRFSWLILYNILSIVKR